MRTPTPVNVASNAWTAITPQGQCSRVTVYETNQAGTTDYYISGTASDTDKTTKPAGSQFIMDAPKHKPYGFTYQEGPLFYIKVVGGSVTFDIVEV
jgi:hypothetical protein